MVLRCCVLNCERTNPHGRVFPNPLNDRKRYLLWLSKCGNNSLLKMTDISVHSNKRICASHFSRSQHIIEDPERRLNRNAIPNVALPEPLTLPGLSDESFEIESASQGCEHKTCCRKASKTINVISSPPKDAKIKPKKGQKRKAETTTPKTTVHSNDITSSELQTCTTESSNDEPKSLVAETVEIISTNDVTISQEGVSTEIKQKLKEKLEKRIASAPQKESKTNSPNESASDTDTGSTEITGDKNSPQDILAQLKASYFPLPLSAKAQTPRETLNSILSMNKRVLYTTTFYKPQTSKTLLRKEFRIRN